MKNYKILCHCLPQNYKKTFNKLKLMGIHEDDLNQFTILPTADHINDAILGSLMVFRIKSDVQALKFCDDMDKLVDNKSSKAHIETLKKGI